MGIVYRSRATLATLNVHLIGDEREQSDLACLLDSIGHHALMLGACTGGTARNDFTAIRDQFVAIPL